LKDFDNRWVGITLGPISSSGSRIELAAPDRAAAKELPRLNGWPVINMGRAQRAEVLTLETAKQGKQLSYSEASRLVRELEARSGLDPNTPVSFSEAQRQVSSIEVK